MEPRFSVAQFNDVINRTLQAVGDVVVEGEITQLGITAKGGVNIVMKDENVSSVLSISGYAPRIEGINMIKEGMKVAAWGIPNLWSMGGKFSLQIYKILPLGEGALKEAYEKLKRQLASEGLFAVERKRRLPEVITKIALLTGRDSAAQSDFLKILRENEVGFSVDYYPVQVQGKYAEKEIVSTLKYVDKIDYDCVVLVRGGGSLEDLITFNSEKVARTIFAMQKPVVVGIGHEKDESIADFVADVRASTPSQAAYYLAQNNFDYLKAQEDKAIQIKSYLQEQLMGYNFKLERRAGFIAQALRAKLQQWQYAFEKKTHGMSQKLYLALQTIKIRAQKLEFQVKRLPQMVEAYQNKISALERLLASYNPKNVLKRGFAIIKTDSGNVVSSVNDVKPGTNINLMVRDGQIISQILKTIHD